MCHRRRLSIFVNAAFDSRTQSCPHICLLGFVKMALTRLRETVCTRFPTSIMEMADTSGTYGAHWQDLGLDGVAMVRANLMKVSHGPESRPQAVTYWLTFLAERDQRTETCVFVLGGSSDWRASKLCWMADKAASTLSSLSSFPSKLSSSPPSFCSRSYPYFLDFVSSRSPVFPYDLYI